MEMVKIMKHIIILTLLLLLCGRADANIDFDRYNHCMKKYNNDKGCWDGCVNDNNPEDDLTFIQKTFGFGVCKKCGRPKDSGMWLQPDGINYKHECYKKVERIDC